MSSKICWYFVFQFRHSWWRLPSSNAMSLTTYSFVSSVSDLTGVLTCKLLSKFAGILFLVCMLQYPDYQTSVEWCHRHQRIRTMWRRTWSGRLLLLLHAASPLITLQASTMPRPGRNTYSDQKPPYSYIALTAMAIQSSPDKVGIFRSKYS